MKEEMAKRTLALPDITHLNDFVSADLISVEGDQKLSPVGIITYSEGKKLIAIGSSWDGRLFNAHLDVEEGSFDPQNLSTGRNRVLNLNDYQGVSLAQIGLDNNVRVDSYASFRTRPSIAVHFKYDDLISGETGLEHVLDEQDLLTFLTQPPGKLAIFDGGGLPENNSLVFEQQRKDQKHALIFFINPKEVELNSVLGLYTLFLHLNEEFQKAGVGSSFQDQALEALELAQKSGVIHFHGSTAREEVFKAILVAHSRLADSTSDAKQTKFLKDHLGNFAPKLGKDRIPALNQSVLERAVKSIHSLIASFADKQTPPVSLQRSVDTTLNSFILNNDPVSPIEDPSEQNTNIFKELKTSEARLLRTAVKGSNKPLDTWDGPYSKIAKYLEGIVGLVRQAQTAEEFSDTLTLLNELHSSPFNRRVFPYRIYHEGSINQADPKISRVEFYNNPADNASAAELIVGLKNELQRRKDVIDNIVAKSNAAWK